jgi:hypothetical protein
LAAAIAGSDTLFRAPGNNIAKGTNSWKNIAKVSSANIRQAGIDLKVDDVLSADETFIQFYYPDRVLVPTGTKRVGSLVPVENERKGVTLMVTTSLMSSSLLPPVSDYGFLKNLRTHYRAHNPIRKLRDCKALHGSRVSNKPSRQ